MRAASYAAGMTFARECRTCLRQEQGVCILTGLQTSPAACCDRHILSWLAPRPKSAQENKTTSDVEI